MPVHARRNAGLLPTIFSGGFNLVAESLPLTKKQKHAYALKQEALYRNRFLECKQKAILKGKTQYPEDPKGDCKSSWKSWQKWRGKAGERALAVAEAAEKKGVLDPAAAYALQADAARALNEDPYAIMQAASQLPVDQQDAYLQETLTTGGVPTWVWVGGAAAAGTVMLVLFLRR